MQLMPWMTVVTVVGKPAGFNVKRVWPTRFGELAENYCELAVREPTSACDPKTTLIADRKQLRDGVSASATCGAPKIHRIYNQVGSLKCRKRKFTC